MNTQEETIQSLKRLLPPGTTVYTKLNYISRSKMMRVIDCYVIVDNKPKRISYSVTEVTSFSYDRRHEGIKVGGYGMDVGREVVYNLSRVLYSDGFECIGDSCPANDHANGDKDRTPHLHNSGGYALRREWL